LLAVIIDAALQIYKMVNLMYVCPCIMV